MLSYSHTWLHIYPWLHQGPYQWTSAYKRKNLVLLRSVKASFSSGTDGNMPGDRCTVCGSTKATDPSVSFHRIPKDLIRRASWTEALQLRKETFGSSTRVCSRHFLNGDTPSILLGKRLASPIKRDPRAKRAKYRED